MSLRCCSVLRCFKLHYLIIAFILCCHSELCAVSKPAGRGLTTSIIVQAAKLASARALVLHSRLNAAILALEEDVKAERERQLLIMQTYNQHVQANSFAQSTSASSLGSTSKTPAAADKRAQKEKHAGIDRNDPILQWSTLHQAAGLWE